MSRSCSIAATAASTCTATRYNRHPLADDEVRHTVSLLSASHHSYVAVGIHSYVTYHLNMVQMASFDLLAGLQWGHNDVSSLTPDSVMHPVSQAATEGTHRGSAVVPLPKLSDSDARARCLQYGVPIFASPYMHVHLKPC